MNDEMLGGGALMSATYLERKGEKKKNMTGCWMMGGKQKDTE